MAKVVLYIDEEEIRKKVISKLENSEKYTLIDSTGDGDVAVYDGAFRKRDPQSELNPVAVNVIVSEDNYQSGDDYFDIRLSEKGLDSLVNEITNCLNKYERIRSVNPLTGLPGNLVINEYLERIMDEELPLGLIYVDLNNFKAYNDYYGFTNGDKIIRFTAAKLEQSSGKFNDRANFTGHIGGDDFILIARTENVRNIAVFFIESFSAGLKSFYDPRDYERGYISVTGRDGIRNKFPLIALSLAGIEDTRKYNNVEELNHKVSYLKKLAKFYSKKENESRIIFDCETGDENRKNLLARLDRDSTGLLKSFLEACGEADDIDYYYDLLAIVKSDYSYKIKKSAIYGLGRLAEIAGHKKRNEIIRLLKENMSDRNAHIRMRSVEAAGIMREPGLFDDIINLVKDHNKYVVAAAVKSLTLYSVPESERKEELVEELITLFRDKPDKVIRHPVIKALAHFHKFMNTDYRERIEDFLISGLRSRSVETVSQLVRALGEVGSIRFLRMITPYLKHSSNYLRMKASESLYLIVTGYEISDIDAELVNLVNHLLNQENFPGIGKAYLLYTSGELGLSPDRDELKKRYFKSENFLKKAILDYLGSSTDNSDVVFFRKVLVEETRNKEMMDKILKLIDERKITELIEDLRNLIKIADNQIRHKISKVMLSLIDKETNALMC